MFAIKKGCFFSTCAHILTITLPISVFFSIFALNLTTKMGVLAIFALILTKALQKECFLFFLL